jgi:hypothetical protein
VICFLSAGFWVWFGAFLATWRLHILIHPDHEGKLGLLMGKGYTMATLVPSFLMVLSPLLFAGVVALLFSLAVLRAIPQARRAIDLSVAGVPHLTVAGVLHHTLRQGWQIALAGVVLASLGAAGLTQIP